MLYRLDYFDGSREAVRDPVIGGDLITRHMATARRRAIELSERDDRPIQISRISGAGLMKPTLIVNPDGRCSRPTGTKPTTEREDCKRERGACFCTACRAERRAARG
jgi:hypothetical protein